jgi:hypothetical protein
VVTPLVEVSPDRSDFAKFGETIAASLVQATQEHANHASVLPKQTKQFADDIRSQVAASSSDPSFHTHASGLMTCEATQDDIRGNPERKRESRCVMAGRAVNAHKAPTNEVGILATIDRQYADEQTSWVEQNRSMHVSAMIGSARLASMMNIGDKHVALRSKPHGARRRTICQIAVNLRTFATTTLVSQLLADFVET